MKSSPSGKEKKSKPSTVCAGGTVEQWRHERGRRRFAQIKNAQQGKQRRNRAGTTRSHGKSHSAHKYALGNSKTSVPPLLQGGNKNIATNLCRAITREKGRKKVSCGRSRYRGGAGKCPKGVKEESDSARTEKSSRDKRESW